MKKNIFVSLAITAAMAAPAAAETGHGFGGHYNVDLYRNIASQVAPVRVSESAFGSDVTFGCSDGLFVQTDKGVHVVDCDALTYDMLVSRTGSDMYIEKIIGVVTDDDGNGRILNTSDDYYNYISYKYVSGAIAGDIVLTYCIYSTENNYEDDIQARYDWIIDRTLFTN